MDPDPGAPKTCGSGSGSPTLLLFTLLVAVDERLIGAERCVPQTLRLMVGSFKMNTALEYSRRVVQEGDRRCKKSTLNDLAYLTPLRIL
jgi:hypothetical protein